MDMTASTPASNSAGQTTAAKQRVLYIGGLGRSGSTLIEKLLNELPQMFAVGETVHLWERGVRDNERCGCGELFRSCEHWTAVGKEAFGGWDNEDLEHNIDLRWSVDRTRRMPAIARIHRGGSLAPEQSEYIERIRAVMLASARVANQPEVLLESSKHLSTAALMALDDQLDVRVLHLLRDPRGVAYSWTKRVERPEAGNELMPIYHPARTAGRWLSDNFGFEALARLGVPTLTMRYEDFLVRPAASLRAITDLMGIEPGDDDWSFLDGMDAKLQTPMHSIAGNPLRFGGEQITLRLDDAWRSKLDRISQLEVTAITVPGLARYRYPIKP
jgi:hypothetical protein